MGVSSSPSAPSRLGRYGVIRRLGIGGMAEVFLCRSRGAEGVDKLLVVKRILPDYSENPHFRAMFIDEARVALRLNHPNVVQVYGFESDGATLLLIMEHVDGTDLGQLAAALSRMKERIPPSHAAYVVREVARGLHYAHERLDEHGRPLEIVHRDVSPTNVLLSYEGSVKIGDFGIARVRSASFEDAGTVQGKFGYMAPEQARGEVVDRRADIYCLGVLLTELLIGHPLFHGVAQGQEILERVRKGNVPDPAALLVDAPEALREVAIKAMRTDRSERFASARDVGFALTDYLHRLESPADALALEHFIHRVMPPKPPPGPPSSRPPPGDLNDIVGAAVTVPGLARGGAGHAGTNGARSTAAGIPSQQPASAPGVALQPITMPSVLAADSSAPRASRVESAAVLRERVHVAVIAGRLTRPVAAPSCRPLVSLIDALAFKADATLEWNREDGFVLIVGAIRPHVDDALRAARLALDILDATQSLALDLASDPSLAPGVMLGLSRGVAGCSRDADGTLLGCELVDDAVPLASSLAATARPGEALVGGGLYRIVRRSFVLREMPTRAGSGSKPFRLERMKTRGERDRTAEAQAWRLLGREAALRELRTTLVGAIAKAVGRSVIVTGELGIGKSTLLGAFATGLATTPGILGEVRVLRVDGTFGAASMPYGLVAQVVRHLLALRPVVAAEGPAPPPGTLPIRDRKTPEPGFLNDNGERTSAPPPIILINDDSDPDESPTQPPVAGARRHGSGEIPALPPDIHVELDLVAERHGHGPGSAGQRAALRALRVCLGLEPEEPGAEAATTRELGLVLRPMVKDVSRDRPLVLLCDALEHADAQSRTVLAELVRKPPRGLVVVIALRDDDMLVGELEDLPTITLGPLELDARRKLIANALGTEEASDELVREISAVAGGNPLTILEVLEALGERERMRGRASGPYAALQDGTVGDSDRPHAPGADKPAKAAPLPTTLEEVLAARLDALAPEARSLMRWCSLCNGDLTLDLVDELGGEEGPRVRARLVSDGILVTKDGDESDTAPVTFAHPALAKVARASIDPTAIAGMHARIAALLEKRRAQPGAHVSPVALARHREAAGAERPAARAWLEAAASFMSRGAYSPDEALRAYGKVLALCREASDGEGYGLLVAAHEGREELARAAGAMQPRRAELLALRRAAAEAREPRLIARALTRQARYKLETAGTDTERDTIAAVRAARRAGDPRTEGEARWVLAVYLGQLGLHREALGQLDAALAALGSKGAFAAPPGGVMEDSIRAVRTLRIEVLLSKSALLRQLGEEGAGLQAVSEAYAIAAGYGPRRLLGAAYDELGMACFAQGGYADALRFFRAAIAVDREVGGRERLGVALAHAGTAWAALGETERALAFLRRALAVLTVMKRYTTVAATVEAHVAAAELLVERNDIEGAAAEIESARTLASATGIRKALLRVARGDAVVHLARRQYRLARSSAEVAEQGARESGLAIEALQGRVLAAEAAAGQGDRLAAWRLLGDVLEDPHFADPARVARGDLVLASCVRAFAVLGDEAGAAHLGTRLDALRRAVAATAPFRSRRETGNDGVGGLEHP